MTAEYLVGRKAGALTEDAREYSDLLFRADRFDGQTLSGLSFRHVTFANNSFKNVRFEKCTFENVVFLSGYFRDTVISDSRFAGCKFVNCDLSRVDLRTTTLKMYNNFPGSFLPFDRVRDCLPEEGNLRQALCSELTREAISVGQHRDAGLFRREALRGERRYLREVLWQRIPYYKEKYGLGDRFWALGKMIRQTLFDMAWGRRRSHAVVLRNWLFLALLFGAVMAALGDEHLREQPSPLEAAMFGALTLFPVQNLYDYTPQSSLVMCVVLTGRLLGLLMSGLFIAILFSRLYEGRR